MTDTNPPELYWSPWLGVLQNVEGREGYRALRNWAWVEELPGDAVRLVPQTDLETQRALTESWQRQYAEMKQRAVTAEDQRGVAWRQLKQILALFDADSDCMEPGDTAEFVREQVAGLREHAIQLPDDADAQFQRTVAGRTGWVTGETANIARDLVALVESWRPATHPTPRLEVDGEAGAWYIRVRDEPVARTTEQEGTVNVDWTQDGRMVGVELLPAAHPTPQVSGTDDQNGRPSPGVLGVDQPNPSAIRIGPGTIPSVRCSACFTRTPVSWHKQGPRVPEHSVDGVYCTGSGTPIDESVFDTHPPTPSDLQASPTLGASDVGGSGATSNGEGGNVGASELTSPAGNLNSDPGNASQLESAGPALETSEPRKEDERG